MRKLVPFLFSALFSAGCTDLQMSLARFKYTPITKNAIVQDSPFDKLSPGLEEHVEKIYIMKQDEFTNGTKAFSINGESTICLPQNYREGDLYHEAAHVRHYALEESGSDFTEKWRSIANIEYGNVQLVKYRKIIMRIQWPDGSVGPKNGCLSQYGGKSLPEDVATFLEPLAYKRKPVEISEAIELLRENPNFNYRSMINSFAQSYPLFFCDPKDTRYQRKLDLLKEYKFLTTEEHAALSENLGTIDKEKIYK